MSVDESTRSKQIETSIYNVLDVVYCEVKNISESHRGHVDHSQDSHFEIVVVSPSFRGLSKISRHRMIFKILEEHFKLGLHALSMKLWTEDEYKNQ
ncbi:MULTISPECIES: BolA family protein [Neorickettsia]|uniref:BolA/IbaG family iron-sulfur metabolism protein n=1 Tax=Neorickettsia findlayensis TaxID=2686014 RepID=A0A6P1GAE2_9RICK|nr:MULTISPECIES: BolA family protein [Neorickettsia]KYH12745.1 BolA family transcriptional regulator [Neorickettsia sp. 179522]QHD65416.1 BolA/IbaG family iron-sulfur metabolism protein [Neorickettsia findlayensis]